MYLGSSAPGAPAQLVEGHIVRKAAAAPEEEVAMAPERGLQRGALRRGESFQHGGERPQRRLGQAAQREAPIVDCILEPRGHLAAEEHRDAAGLDRPEQPHAPTHPERREAVARTRVVLGVCGRAVHHLEPRRQPLVLPQQLPHAFRVSLALELLVGRLVDQMLFLPPEEDLHVERSEASLGTRSHSRTS